MSNTGYLSPFTINGKFIFISNVSVFTIPAIIENLSSVLFKGAVNKHEYPGGVFIVQGFNILLIGKFKFFFTKGESPTWSVGWSSGFS